MADRTIKIDIVPQMRKFVAAMHVTALTTRRVAARFQDFSRTPGQRAVHNHLIAISAATYADLGLVPPADSVVRERLPLRTAKEATK